MHPKTMNDYETVKITLPHVKYIETLQLLKVLFFLSTLSLVLKSTI